MTYKTNVYTAIHTFTSKHENTINVLLNHLAVVYVFFVSFAPHGYAVSFIFTIMYILLFLRGNYIKYLRISLSNPITIAFLLMQTIYYLWFLGSNDIDAAYDALQYSHYLLYPFFFFLFLDQKFYARLLTSFLAGVMLSELLTYLIQFSFIPKELILHNIQFPWKANGHLKEIIFYRSINNEPAPFLEHSWYSILLATASSILFYKSLHSKTSRLKIIYLGFFITISIDLFFIGGRIGYLLYILLLLTNLFLLKKEHISKRHILISLSAPLIVGLSMYQLSGLFQQRINLTLDALYTINDTAHNIDGSFSERFLMAKAGIEAIPDNFLLGVGTGDQRLILRSKPNNINNPIQHHRDVHNQYIDIFIQFGFIGFLVYLNLFYQITKVKIEDQEKESLKKLFLLAIIYTGFFGSFWYFLPVLFTILIIISTANKNIITATIEASNNKVIIGYILMIILSYTIEKLQ
jgi:O-antigen ligase